MAIKLTIIQPNLREQRYSCHGCGNCCRDFTVQLRDEDVAKIEEQGWVEKLGLNPMVEFRGTRYLRQREDGACVFWMADGRCRIHAEFGFEEKPIACQLFPFSLTPAKGGAVMGVNFACQSVLENKGAELRSHVHDLKRMAKALPEVQELERPPMLTAKLRASEREVDAIISRIDAWLRRDDLDLAIRLNGLTWVIDSLHKAKVENVRERRFADLLDALFGALPPELAFHPIAPPTAGHKKMLRQAVFARVEDPKIGRVEKTGRARTSLAQLMRSRRFAKGKGRVPSIGVDWPEGVRLETVEEIEPAHDPEQVAAIDDLITRWLRATILGGRAWGAGYYGWPIVDGLQAMMLNVAAVGWLARLHAAGGCSAQDESSRPQNPRAEPGANGAGGAATPKEITIIDVRAALGRIDRTSGRARWLGSRAERWRLRYFNTDAGLRRLMNRYAMTMNATTASDPAV